MGWRTRLDRLAVARGEKLLPVLHVFGILAIGNWHCKRHSFVPLL
jgi:hypothetical protein